MYTRFLFLGSKRRLPIGDKAARHSERKQAIFDNEGIFLSVGFSYNPKTESAKGVSCANR